MNQHLDLVLHYGTRCNTNMTLRIWRVVQLAESLQRLREGKNIQEHDLILIGHESLEYDLMNKSGLSYEEAHLIANKSFNYKEALDRWLDEQES